MKKTVLVVLVLLLSLIPLAAQSSFGIKGGISDFSFIGDDWDDMSSFFGIDNEISISYSLGIFSETLITETFAFQPELLFTSANMKYGDGDDWIKETWNMVEIPIYAKGVFNNNTGSFYAMAGPDIFYILGDVKSEDNYSNSGSSEPDNSLLFGIAAAVGYEMDNNSFFGIKYSRVFSEYVDDVDILIHGFGIEGGFKF
jgi:hypothetical protein